MSFFHLKSNVGKAQTRPASPQQPADQHLDHWPTQPWPPPSQPVQMTASETHTHTHTRLQTKQSMRALWLQPTCTTYQDSLSLLGIWIDDCGKLRIRILLFLDSTWRTKVKSLEGRLDEGVADPVDRCMHDFHLRTLVYVSEKRKHSEVWRNCRLRCRAGLGALPRASPVVAVFLDGFEILRLDVLVGVFEQGALQGLLCVPGLGPGLKVVFDGFGDPCVMRANNLGPVLPVHLRHRQRSRGLISVPEVLFWCDLNSQCQLHYIFITATL